MKPCREYYIPNKPACFIEQEAGRVKLLRMENERKTACTMNRIHREIRKLTKDYEAKVALLVLEAIRNHEC